MNEQNELKTMGLKATFPRLKILDVFCKADHRHQSAEDVYRALIGENVEIGLATVYRVLTQFEQAGILSRSQFDSSKRSEEHTSELQSLMRISYAVFCLKKKKDKPRSLITAHLTYNHT